MYSHNTVHFCAEHVHTTFTCQLKNKVKQIRTEKLKPNN